MGTAFISGADMSRITNRSDAVFSTGMNANSSVGRFWWCWLVVITIGVMIFGISMVLLPGPLLKFFSLIVYSSSQHISALAEPAVTYIKLVHGILGAVMFGWGVALLCILLGPFRTGNPGSWRTLAFSLMAWFVPDTAISLWYGFWHNAVFNLVIATLFAVPLAATRMAFGRERTSSSASHDHDR